MNRTKIEEMLKTRMQKIEVLFENTSRSSVEKSNLEIQYKLLQELLTSLLAEDGGEVKVTEDKIAEYLAFRYEFDNHLMRCITHNLQTMKKDESDEWRVNDFFSHNLHKMFTQSDVASQHTKGERV